MKIIVSNCKYIRITFNCINVYIYQIIFDDNIVRACQKNFHSIEYDFCQFKQ